MTSGIKVITYEQMLLEVNLTFLEEKRLRGDLIQTWKILHGYDKVMEQAWFNKAVDAAARTRQSSCAYNLTVKRFKSNLRKNSFVLNPWNCSPDIIKEASTLNKFKYKYDALMMID